jgi:hypothetical protein
MYDVYYILYINLLIIINESNTIDGTQPNAIVASNEIIIHTRSRSNIFTICNDEILTYICLNIFIVQYAIIKIVYGLEYDNIKYDTSMNLTINNWLLVESVIELTMLNVIIIWENYPKQFIKILAIILTLFNLCWTIIGSILYLQEYKNIESQKISDLIMIVLIINYIILLVLAILFY